ncbi:hypothetical protein ACFOOP_14460 [Marinicaulis aureus]|uniref:Uncharacterized protein n=1 Tax=Hyphococcus aureus TaxID=2666033 RepID=A0ABW1L1W9_9PROT
MNLICAFSSDARPLYKADIYRALALPKGYILHFRYQRKYIHQDVLDLGTKILGRKVAIFFSRSLGANTATTSYENYSIRYATVTAFDESPETNVYHVYMKLDDFCNVVIRNTNQLDYLPPNKFFTNLECAEMSQDMSWRSRVLAIKDYLPKLLFFNVSGVFDGNRKIALSYSNKKRSSHFEITQGQRHILKVSLGNPQENDVHIEVTDKGDEIELNSINPLQTSASFDDLEIPISSKALQVRRQSTFLKFRLSNSPDKVSEYTTNIEFDIVRSKWSAIAFGFFATVALAAFSAMPSMSFKGEPLQPHEYAVFLVWFLATAGLYYYFNKK